MDRINIRRINCAQTDGAAKLTTLRAQLGLQADVVSPRGRQLTEAVFEDVAIKRRPWVPATVGQL